MIIAAISGGRPQQAVEWAREAMEDTASELGPTHYRTAFQTALYADALAAAGDRDGARANFATSIPTLLAGAGQATDDPGQARVDRWRSAVLDGYLAVLAEDGSPAAVEEAFRIADAARGQSVQRAVAAAAARSAMRDPASADLIRREQGAKRQVDALIQLLASGYAAPTGERDDAALARLRTAIDQQTREHEALRAEIGRRIPDYARLSDPQPPIGGPHIGGSTPSLPTTRRSAASVPSAFFIAITKTTAPGLIRPASPGASVTTGASGATSSSLLPPL